MSAQEELHEGTSPASEEPSNRTPFRLFEDVDTTDSEGEAEPGPQHAESPAPEVTPELLATIVKQVEFYFSDANLPTDKKLLKQVKKDPSGYVPVKLFANFRKIRILTKDPDIIAMALQESKDLVLSADQRSVRRRVPVPDYSIPDLQRRIVVVEHLPAGNTIESVSEIFSVFGRVKVVRICSRDSRGKLPGWMTAVCATSTSQQHAFVEYDLEEDAIKAAAHTYPEDDPLHAVRVGRLSVLLAALPPQLQPQSQLSQSPSWRDDSQHSKPRSRGGAGSGRPSREPSPMGLRQSLSRLQHASGSSGGNRPLGRRSVDHSAQEGGSRTPGSSGGADTAAVWGHDGFHANDHKPLQRRMSHDRDRHGSHGCGTPDTRSWHHDVSSPSAAAAAAIGSKPGAYVAPFRRDDPLSAVPASLRTHNASGASSPAHSPASPRVTRTSPDAMGVPGSPRMIRTSPDAAAEHHQFTTYAAAALAESPLGSGEPRSPGKPPAGLRPSPSSGHRPSGLSGASSAAGTPRKGAAPRAAVDAVLADVLAAAAIVKARDDASGDGGDGGGALKSRLSGQRGSSPSASVEEIGGLINKIITSPIVRCGSGDQSAFATPTVTDAAAAAAAGLTGPEAMAVGDLISKILSDIPAPGASPTSGSGPRSPEGMLSPKASPKKQQQQPRQQPEGTGSNAAPGVGPIAASVAPAAGGCGADHGSAIAMGRQLSVVPEGNEMERLMSAQLDGSLFAAAQQAIAIDRELSLGLRDEAGMLALAAAVGSPQRLSANRAAAQAAAKQAGGETTLTFSPPAAASQPIAITGKPPLAGEDHSGDSSDGGEGGEGGKTGRRRRTRRSRRRSCVTPSEGAVGSPALSNDGGSLPPTAAQMRDTPRQRRNSSGSAAASRRVSDGASAAGVGGGGNKDGSGSEASKAKKHTKKDYAAWAAATPEYRAEASAKYGSGAGSLPPASPPRPRSALSPMASPPRARRPSDGHHAHDVHGVSHAVPSKGPDGSRGFAMGRGKPLAPPPPA